MALDIKQERLENMVTVLNAVTGEKVQNGMDALARLVKTNEGNDVTATLTDNCKIMQTCYNDSFVPVITTVLDEYGKLDEFRGLIARAAANMSTTKVVSSSFSADPVELPQI